MSASVGSDCANASQALALDRRWLLLLNQRYRVTGYSFLAAGEAEAIGGGSLYAYLLRIKA